MKNNKQTFLFPSEDIISIIDKNSPSNAYTHPIIRRVFWNRFITGFNLISDKKFGCIVEIGTSLGYILPSLCTLGDTVIGTDVEAMYDKYYPVILKQLKERYHNLDIYPADATELTSVFPENSCDLICAFSVLEHIKNYRQAMDEIKKCLKPGGIFLCELPRENWFYKLGRAIVRYHNAHPGFYYPAYREYLRSIFLEKKLKNAPYGIPLFKVGIYQKPQ